MDKAPNDPPGPHRALARSLPLCCLVPYLPGLVAKAPSLMACLQQLLLALDCTLNVNYDATGFHGLAEIHGICKGPKMIVCITLSYFKAGKANVIKPWKRCWYRLLLIRNDKRAKSSGLVIKSTGKTSWNFLETVLKFIFFYLLCICPRTSWILVL